ncbi:hypothetical protein GCM10009554_42100 [Kribbella koreensis]|uniref:Uncharacterized protein n=2 Tax=Kribbella TaxID=182639 RepID=A0ABP6VNN8_9ACTN
MSSVRNLLIAATLGTASIVAAPVGAQASGTQVQAGLKITHIVCHQQEDFTGADDAYLVQDGKVLWGPVQMISGDSKDIQDVPVTQDHVLTLMEGDSPDDDDNLGAKKITGAGDYQFTDDEANYTVTIANQ